MNEELTEIVVVLDRSGSMESMADEAVSGFNAFVAAQRQEPGQARLSLVLFDHEYLTPFTAVPLEQVEPLTDQTYQPRGMTALLDAMGRGIDETGARLAQLPEAERPGQVIFVTLTDGFENASHDYTQETVKAKITHQQEAYQWSFVFLAADPRSMDLARAMNIPQADRVAFEADKAGVLHCMEEMSLCVSEGRRKQRKASAPIKPADSN